MSGWDYSDTEAAMVAWVQARTQVGPDAWCRKVGTRMEIGSVAEEMQVTPAVYVVYGNPVVKAADDDSYALHHRWFLVLALATPAAQRDASAMARLAGPKLAQLANLHGKTLTGCRSPLRLATPAPPLHMPKFSYYALAFTCESNHCND
ncbi:hypothetical protein [uncultured Pseudacidovorax sp.]|uniref:phage tail terminator protein n=1 Tax=uncultured Pseudacidovorax sp. TaxID=679313 RepID=UPI0025D3179F|nr:hypothetical protein [uncultured Pseudacidovorax sp.]